VLLTYPRKHYELTKQQEQQYCTVKKKKKKESIEYKVQTSLTDVPLNIRLKWEIILANCSFVRNLQNLLSNISQTG